MSAGVDGRARAVRWSAPLAAALALALVACTGQRPTLQPAERPVPVARWSSDFCAAYGTWADVLDLAGATAAAELDPADRPAARSALVELFATSGTATTTLVTAIGAGAPPDIEGGAGFVDDLEERFGTYGTALEEGLAAAEALDVDDEATFLVQATALRDDYRDGRTAAQDAFTALGTTEAGAALADAVAAACEPS